MSAYHIANAWKKWNETRDYEASDVIVRQYKPLVDYHVNRILTTLPKTIHQDDIESLGMAGLYEALLKYDPSRNIKFETYASQRIRGTILDGLRKEDRMSRVYRARYKKIQETFIQLEQKHQREVGIDEVAAKLGMSSQEVQDVLTDQLTSELISMDENVQGIDNNATYIDTIQDDSITPEEEVIKNDLILQMADKIKKLDDREQKILSLFYQEELTLTEIGKVVGLSKGRVSQVHSQALSKLKRMLG
ncbi:FliA/WhiG family RNA polymerase sigma factor (plasmid) [Rossellomorea sp. AcN35-11]|nr:FliA/WhiG family RNA polymerase sigma factor [Rossellomorea aquimaris]WJV32304.1 FliA/WhiG family RNA polymerase sigma factor [Rossellomorea sp. AcN35-11]